MATRVLFCAAAVSAYELPALSRRAVLRAVSVAPLAAVAPALADSNNEYLGYKYPTDIGVGLGNTKGLPKDGFTYNKLDSKKVDISGAAVQDKALFSPSYISKSAPPRAVAGVRLGGTYSDPQHPGCKRKITLIGTNKVLIDGADEDGKPWKVRGTYEGKTITVDFTPKGGPAGVTATYSIAGGLTFPDGNTWKKI